MRLQSALVCAFLAQLATGAQAISFTDERLWQSALSAAHKIETFESFADATPVTKIASLGLELAPLLPSLSIQPNVINRRAGLSSSGSKVLANFNQPFLPSLPSGLPIVLTLSAKNALLYGLGYWNVGGDDTTRLSFYAQNGDLIESVVSPSVNNNFSFVGIISTIPAAKVSISAATGNGFFTLDDLQVQVTVVPEPGSWALWAAGLGLLAARRQVRRGRGLVGN